MISCCFSQANQLFLYGSRGSLQLYNFYSDQLTSIAEGNRTVRAIVHGDSSAGQIYGSLEAQTYLDSKETTLDLVYCQQPESRWVLGSYPESRVLNYRCTYHTIFLLLQEERAKRIVLFDAR